MSNEPVEVPAIDVSPSSRFGVRRSLRSEGLRKAGARGATSWWSNEMVGGPEIDVSFVQIQAGEVSATELGAQVGGRGVDGVGGGVARQS